MSKYLSLTILMLLVFSACTSTYWTKRYQKKLVRCDTVKINGWYEISASWDSIKEHVAQIEYRLDGKKLAARGEPIFYTPDYSGANFIFIADLLPHRMYKVNITFDSIMLMPEVFSVSIYSQGSTDIDTISGQYVFKSQKEASFLYRSSGYETNILVSTNCIPEDLLSSRISTYSPLSCDTIKQFEDEQSITIRNLNEYTVEHSLDPSNIQDDSLRSIINSLRWQIHVESISFTLIEPEQECGGVILKYDPIRFDIN